MADLSTTNWNYMTGEWSRYHTIAAWYYCWRPFTASFLPSHSISMKLIALINNCWPSGFYRRWRFCLFPLSCGAGNYLCSRAVDADPNAPGSFAVGFGSEHRLAPDFSILSQRSNHSRPFNSSSAWSADCTCLLTLLIKRGNLLSNQMCLNNPLIPHAFVILPLSPAQQIVPSGWL